MLWNIKKHQVGSEFVMAYFVLQFIPEGRQIISQLVCNERRCEQSCRFHERLYPTVP
jgi:hypothetical protein